MPQFTLLPTIEYIDSQLGAFCTLNGNKIIPKTLFVHRLFTTFEAANKHPLTLP